MAEVITTLNGPLIKINSKYVSLHEPHLLIDAFEEYPNLLEELKNNIWLGLRDGADELMESLLANVQMFPARLSAYMAAANQYIGFLQAVWEPYQAAKIEDITDL